MFIVVYVVEANKRPRRTNRCQFSTAGHKSVRSPHMWRVSGRWFDTKEGAQEYADNCSPTRQAFVVEAPVDPFVTIGGEE